MNEINERGQNLVAGPNQPGQGSAWIHSEKHFLYPSFGIHHQAAAIVKRYRSLWFCCLSCKQLCGAALRRGARHRAEDVVAIRTGSHMSVECQNSCRRCEQGSRSRGAFHYLRALSAGGEEGEESHQVAKECQKAVDGFYSPLWWRRVITGEGAEMQTTRGKALGKDKE